MRVERRIRGVALALGTLAFAAGSGCSSLSLVTGGGEYVYFAQPDPGDAWSRKIRAWQARERGDEALDAPAGVAVSGDEERGAAETVAVPDSEALRSKYDAFRSERKRAMARDLAAWIQDEAPRHYVPDGPVDHWATLEETFRSNGDDCDGLELLAYHFLRDLGFGPDEVFRAIVYRRSDGQHHMVTLWFEDPDDPWVIDPTGAMTLGMPRMSEVPGWVPLKVFSEDQDFTVRRSRVAKND